MPQGELFKADGEVVGTSTGGKCQQAYGVAFTTTASGVSVTQAIFCSCLKAVDV